MAQFNQLEVTVGANTRPLRSGLRQASRVQSRYAIDTRRTFENLSTRLSNLAISGGLGILGAVGISGMSASQVFSSMRRIGDQYNQMSDIQRRALTSGQRSFRQFAGEIAIGAGVASITLETLAGRMTEIYGLSGRTFDPEMFVISQQMEAAQRRAPVGATPFGRDLSRVAQIMNVQRQMQMREELNDYTRRRRERVAGSVEAAVRGLGGLATGDFIPTTLPGMAGRAQRAAIRGGATVARGVSGPLGVVLSWSRLMYNNPPQNFN